MAVQSVVPMAIPLAPRSLIHITQLSPTLSEAVPASVRKGSPVLYVGPEVGDVMVMVGCDTSRLLPASRPLPSTRPLPVTRRERVSPSAVKLAFVLTASDAVGVKRTVTAWVAPIPTRVNGLPDTMLKGAETDAFPETVPSRVF